MQRTNDSVTTVRLHYYQQFDADFSLDVPAEGYGGWKSTELPIDLERTALVVMHAWDTGARTQYAGWHRAVESIPRAETICREVFPALLSAVRRSPMTLFHVVSKGEYYRQCPGYIRAKRLVEADPPPAEQIEKSATWETLNEFRRDHVFVGPHNRPDVQRGFQDLDFAPQAHPVGDEGIAEDGLQLFHLCRHHGVDHLIYVGFAINWCLLLSPGGMAELSRHGLICSTIRQAITAVENKETARQEICKQVALWRVALAFGFVFDLDDVLSVLPRNPRLPARPPSEGAGGRSG